MELIELRNSQTDSTDSVWCFSFIGVRFQGSQSSPFVCPLQISPCGSVLPFGSEPHGSVPHRPVPTGQHLLDLAPCQFVFPAGRSPCRFRTRSRGSEFHTQVPWTTRSCSVQLDVTLLHPDRKWNCVIRRARSCAHFDLRLSARSGGLIETLASVKSLADLLRLG